MAEGIQEPDLLKEMLEAAGWSDDICSPLKAARVQAVRERVLPGETLAHAKLRWARERVLEEGRRNENGRVFTGQVLPVRYE